MPLQFAGQSRLRVFRMAQAASKEEGQGAFWSKNEIFIMEIFRFTVKVIISMKNLNWIAMVLLVLGLVQVGCSKKKSQDNQAMNPNDIPIPTASASPAVVASPAVPAQ